MRASDHPAIFIIAITASTRSSRDHASTVARNFCISISCFAKSHLFCLCGLTFDMRGLARLAGTSPLDGRVRRLVH